MDTEDGDWSLVSHKRGRGCGQAQSQGRAKQVDGRLVGIQPNPNPEFTVSDMQKYHDAVRQDWHASECWQILREILVAASSAPNRPIIKRAICLGPGSFDPANGSFSMRRTAHMQTEAFCSIVDTLESNADQKIIRVVQEPGFTQADKDFCSHIRLEAVETPCAFSLVDESTMVFGIHMELGTYHRALLAPPGIFIGADLSEWENLLAFNPALEELMAPLREIDATYDKHAFPDLNYMFSGTAIYFRGSQQATERPPTQADGALI
ncbi:hypothetical protein B0H67DRAFT_638651 [Lasiosphaeris hirsuta]|uniref:SRR1-like domain-containing protein n=1 Tax=Lasiosphaeris hirsuta TaxID=260670 RepID=A0AA40ECA9_9PEZI|nr:hypothetical protein B0H67DRAFT_638651 [Lasiosphaeris hirsuta]